jgi:NAD(P)-dependent dehydrogenase (short-subunit alcohol dehydrogenase family)
VSARPDLTGRIALVTGAGRGFGRAIATALAAAGAAVAVTARSRDQIEEAASTIEAVGGRTLAVAADVTRRGDVDDLLAAVETGLGSPDILVNNAGITGPFGPVWAVDPDQWWATQEVHVRGALLTTHAVLPGMRRRGRGCIINVSARAGQAVAPNLSAYAVAKAAQIRLTEHVAQECREDGIAVFAIEPGTVITGLAESTLASADARRWLPGMVQRLGELREQQDPADGLARCADLCLALASGRYDVLSGRYLDVADDLEALLQQMSAG